MGSIGCPETSVRITTIRCVISQKSSGLIHFAVEACNLPWLIKRVCPWIEMQNKKLTRGTAVLLVRALFSSCLVSLQHATRHSVGCWRSYICVMHYCLSPLRSFLFIYFLFLRNYMTDIKAWCPKWHCAVVHCVISVNFLQFFVHLTLFSTYILNSYAQVLIMTWYFYLQPLITLGYPTTHVFRYRSADNGVISCLII
jgi:hypothetical protein